MIALSRRKLLTLSTALAAAWSVPALAHHGWGGYDTALSFTVTGEIQESSYANPHCEIVMTVDGRRWHFVLAPPSRMERRGITAEMIAPGKTCTVFGYPNKTDPNEARIEYIILDGKRIELR